MSTKNLTEEPLFTIPAETEDLIDKVAALNIKKKLIEAELNFLKEATKARLSLGEHKGRLYQCVVNARSRTGLDSDAVKAEMGDDWWAARQKITEYQEIRFEPIDKVG